MMDSTQPIIHAVYESKTGSWQYVVADPTTQKAVIIDPVLDFDPATATISTQTADSLITIVKEHSYDVDLLLETHAHADHMTAASYLRKSLSEVQSHQPMLGIGKRIQQVHDTFCARYRMSQEEYADAFDKLFDDDDIFKIGSLHASAMYLPGHTPDHMGYKIGDNVFVGDSIFHIDLGSARCDFPGGSPETLFSSIRKLLNLPGHVKVWIGHDYPPGGAREPVASITVAEHRRDNKHLKDSIEEHDYVTLRKERDATLAEPKLLHQAMQMNLRGGRLPEPTEMGMRMLYVPLKFSSEAW